MQMGPLATCMSHWLSLGNIKKTSLPGYDSKLGTHPLENCLGRASRPCFVQQLAVVGLHHLFPTTGSMAWCLQGLQPEVRTYNTAIIACNMCGQPHEALKVSSQQTCLKF